MNILHKIKHKAVALFQHLRRFTSNILPKIKHKAIMLSHRIRRFTYSIDINYTLLAVVLFILLTTVALLRSKEANAEGLYLELGSTILNSQMTTHGVGYRKGGYGIAYEKTGVGETKRGPQEVNEIYSIYKTIDPQWSAFNTDFKVVIGKAYTPNQRLIGKTNFRLELVLTYKDTAEFFVRHYSSAGLWETNTGLDSFGFRLLLD